MHILKAVGTKVKMHPQSIYASQCFNARGQHTDGRIIGYESYDIDLHPGAEVSSDRYYYTVQWDNGHENCYPATSLIFPQDFSTNKEAAKVLLKNE